MNGINHEFPEKKDMSYMFPNMSLALTDTQGEKMITGTLQDNHNANFQKVLNQKIPDNIVWKIQQTGKRKY